MTHLPLRMADWPPEAVDHYEERAAIMQHMGRMPREQAERLARQETIEEWRRR